MTTHSHSHSHKASHEAPAAAPGEPTPASALVPGDPLFPSVITRDTKTGALVSKPLTEDELKQVKTATSITYVRTAKDAGVVIASGGELDGKTLRAFDSSKDAVEWCEQLGLVCGILAQ